MDKALETIKRGTNEIISTELAGLAITVKKDIGAVYNPGQAVVTMIDPNELRVDALIEEDKGLNDIIVGQKVNFTVDAFGSKQFQGVVESIKNTSNDGDVVFNISDKRQEKQFEIKIKYDSRLCPQFQNGMSAKAWIIK